MGLTLTDVLLFGGASSSDVDSAELVILRRNMLRWISTSGYVDVIVSGVAPLSLPDAVADGLKYVKAFGGTEARNVPEGYQELEYIEGTVGTQYINTGIVPTSSMSVYYKTSNVSTLSGSDNMLCLGSRTATWQGLVWFVTASSQTMCLDWFGTNSTSRWNVSSVSLSAGNVWELSIKNSLAEAKCNGTSLGTHQFTPSGTETYPIFLNAMNNAGSAATVPAITNRIYRFTVAGICDMIPAKRLADDAIGMWDKIRKQFFTNADTGTFTAGAVVALPEGYTLLDSVTGYSSKAIFSTGVAGGNNNLSFKFNAKKSSAASYSPFFGNYDGESKNCTRAICSVATGVIAEINRQSSGSEILNTVDVTAEHTYELYKTNVGVSVLKVDGSIVEQMADSAGETNNSIIAVNASYVLPAVASSTTTTTFKYFQIYDNGVLIRDYVPARRDSDGKVGMYDLVNNTFNYSIFDTDQFTAGNVVSPSPTKPPDIWCNNGAVKAIRPLEYLESTGTQYIDTGIVPNQDTRVELDGQIISTAAAAFFGVRTDATTDVYAIQRHSSGKIAMGYNDLFGLTDVDADTNRHVWYKNKNLQYIDGNLAFTANYSDFTAMGTAILFGFNNNGSKASSVSLRVYSCKIWDGDTLIRDFIPALDANNIPCLFDKVEGKCYYNAGTGQFIAPYLPAEYEELEYIQGANNGQYIDTGIVPTSSMNMYAKIGIAQITAGSSLFGARTVAYGGATTGLTTDTLHNDWFGSSAADRWSISGLTFNSGDILEISVNNSLWEIKQNSTSLGTHQFTPATTTTYALYLNALNNAGSVGSSNSIIRIYRFTVAGVADMIPARKRSNGHIGMYDLVRRQFFENAGSGSFTVGKLPILPDGYTQLDYVEGTQTQWIDTGVKATGGAVIEVKGRVGQTGSRQFFVGSVDGQGGTPDTSRNLITYNATTTTLRGQKVNISGTTSEYTIDPTKDFVAVLNTIGSNMLFTVDGNIAYQNSSTNTLGTQTNTIKVNYSDWDASAYNGRYYYVKVWSNDNTLVRYLIPAKRNSDGVVGMYDIMNDVFLTNQGTGDFEYGSEIPDSRESHYYIDGVVEKVGIHSASNKNLFNGAFEQGGIFQGNKVSATTRIRTPNPISLAAGTYTVSCASAYEIWVEINNVSGVTWGDSKTITVSATDKIMIAVRNKIDPSTTLISPDEAVNVQVEAGSTATAYSPYYDGGLAVCQDLFGLPNYVDEQEILDGDITRKVGVYVLTGEEWWEKLNFAGKSVFRAKVVIPADRYSNPENNVGLCSHFTVIPTSASVTSLMNNLELAWNTNSLMCIRYDSMSTLNDFLAFLRSQYDAGTPVTIVYPLATASTESVAGQTLTVSAGNNTAEIMQASIDDLELEVKYTKNS